VEKENTFAASAANILCLWAKARLVSNSFHDLKVVAIEKNRGYWKKL